MVLQWWYQTMFSVSCVGSQLTDNSVYPVQKAVFTGQLENVGQDYSLFRF